ncbi:MAG: hypothetical protein WCF95_03875 [bacterium]
MNDKKQNEPIKKDKNPKKIDIKNLGLNLDKMEYQQIVLSDSNFPDKRDFREGNF